MTTLAPSACESAQGRARRARRLAVHFAALTLVPGPCESIGVPLDLSLFSTPGRVGRVNRLARGFELAVGSEWFRAEVVRPDVLRLAVSRAGAWDPRPTFATCYAPPPEVRFEVEERATDTVLTTEALSLSVQRDELHFDVHRADGTPVLLSARAPSGASLAYVELNDAFALAREAKPSDLVLGLGEKTGPVNRRGRSYTLFNIDVLSPDVLTHSSLVATERPEDPVSTSFDPYYASTSLLFHGRRQDGALRVAGSFVDNGYLGRVDLTPATHYTVAFHGGAYVEYVLAGPTLAGALEAYTFLTGRAPLPPLWALGHHQCRWHHYTDHDLAELGREYRARGIPCDALWLDIEHMDGFRVFSFHPERFPNPEQTFESLRAEGFRCVTIVDPGVKREPGNALFEAGVAGGHFCKTQAGTLYEGRVWPGRTVFPDFSRAETRAFWSELVARHARRGVAGLWNDMNEPATGAVEPFSMRFDRDRENHPHERFHNQYALLMALATQAGLLAARPEERPFVLSRAGSAGIQRVAAQWLGDHCASFEHLAMGLPMALGLGLSGQPFVGGDVPGFAGIATPELAARWFEYAAVTPFCRAHHQIDHPPHYPWSFGPDVEHIAREALRLRYRLIPYLYAAFLAANETGAPVQRPLLFDFPDDPLAATIDDEFMLGDALLVAPVLAPSEDSRAVYLPRGDWFDWRSGERHAGGRAIEVSAPPGKMPLFARAGSVVPLWETAPATTLGYAPECVELHAFVPETDAGRTSVLYEDDGQSFGYQRDERYLTELALERAQGALRLAGTTTGSGFAGFARRRLRVSFHGATPREVTLNGRAVAVVDGKVTFDNRAESFELRGVLE